MVAAGQGHWSRSVLSNRADCRLSKPCRIDRVSDPLPLIAAVGLGGTKCVCLLGSGPGEIVDRRRIPTGAPDETLAAIEAVLDGWQVGPRAFAALGIVSFCPADGDPGSGTWGGIL